MTDMPSDHCPLCGEELADCLCVSVNPSRSDERIDIDEDHYHDDRDY